MITNWGAGARASDKANRHPQSQGHSLPQTHTHSAKEIHTDTHSALIQFNKY